MAWPLSWSPVSRWEVIGVVVWTQSRASVCGLGRGRVTTNVGISELNSQAEEPSRNTMLRVKT